MKHWGGGGSGVDFTTLGSYFALFGDSPLKFGGAFGKS